MSSTPLHPEFGAQITGIDLSRPLTAEQHTAVRDAIDRFSFLVFPDQRLCDESQLAFTRQLGEPEVEHVKFGRSGVVDFFGTIGNIGKDGTQQGNDHKETRFGSGNHMWHSDSSFRQVPTMVTITYAHEVPDEGGQTEFVSCRAAYAGLPDAMKAEMDGLVAIHDYVFSRSKVAPVDPSHAASLPPVEQRLVRTNPSTGARNYFVGSHARSIVGWDEAASRNLIEDLMARATREQNILSHTWRPGDLVIWDNRCLLHRGRPYDADRYRRYIRQNRVCGVGPTLEE
ncbi:MAG: TauD/TfdA family dioxygenase [Alphaproteobacteria bacterium]|nr:TauD/TfdA family dioxygenase [Alphaproteobacteria bacterium]